MPVFPYLCPEMKNYSIDELHLLTLHVGLAYHDGDWNFHNVRSPFARLYLVVEGTARISLPTGCYDLTPGHLYFIPPFTTHSYYCDSPFTHYYIHIYEERNGGTSILDELDFPVEVDAEAYDIDLMKRLVGINPFLRLPTPNPDVYDNHPTLVSNLQQNLRRPFCDKVESRGILFLLFSRFLQHATPKAELRDSRVEQALVFIRQHLCSAIDVNQLAGMSSLSRDHFIRIFRQATGETPKSYVLKRRMETAELRLLTSEDSIKQIALSLGYEDYSYFTKSFKAFSGMTPQEYRKKHHE